MRTVAAVDAPGMLTGSPRSAPDGFDPAHLERDIRRTADFLARGQERITTLPEPTDRTPDEEQTARAAHRMCRRVRREFLGAHMDNLYRSRTDNLRRSMQLDELMFELPAVCPGLAPDRELIAADRRRMLRDKEGWEIDQGLLAASVLGNPTLGAHLTRSMLRPTTAARKLLPEFRRTGWVDLGAATVRRHDGAAHLSVRNPRYLNAEDDEVVRALEIAVDLALLDDEVAVGVLRGDIVGHHRYAGRRIFNAGINLTQLYRGQISFLDFLLQRELGYINKIFRGLAVDGADGQDVVEKPWLGVVDSFAIGGGMQLLLVLDRVIAETGAYFTLPALREGIIPGAANLRLSRIVGNRLARNLIFTNRRIAATDVHAALFCDEVVDVDRIDERVAASVDQLANPAVVSNRRVLHLAEEPPDAFRQYMANYAREQALRLFSSDLVDNLERDWINRRKT
jgi:thioesterase DpgC